MKKITYLLAAGGIAGLLGYFLGCFFSCGESESSLAAAAAFALIAGIIGLIVGWIADAEEKAAEEERIRKEAEERARREARLKAQREEERKQEDERRFQDWSDKLKLMYRKIEKNVGWDFEHEPIYQKIEQESNPAKLSARQKNAAQTIKNAHIAWLKREIYNSLQKEMGYGGLAMATRMINCLTIAEPNVEANIKAEKVLIDTCNVAQEPLCYISFNGYGDCNLRELLERDSVMMAEEAAQMLESVQHEEQKLKENKDNVIFAILHRLSPMLIQKECALMWYYANKKPFDVNSFEKARKLYMSHTAMYCECENLPEDVKAFTFGSDDFKVVALGKVEEVLARIYAKNLIGGKTTVNQEKGYINLWLDRRVAFENFDDCYHLASGLAWMELYELELDVLRKLVSYDVQLPTELQERLSFLESGGTSNIKLYEVEESSTFYFDNSSAEWKTADFAVLFRKMAMKKKCINYSMLISKWTKTLPLSSGQKLSSQHINRMLESMVKDFDDEVSFHFVDASALNMANVQYHNVVLFRFNKERTRCVSVLFAYEKFGRNLNLTILTFFTPDCSLSFDELEKYCLAIKDNVYVESFRESILQVVDEAIKVKQTVYGDDVDVPSKKIVFVDEE